MQFLLPFCSCNKTWITGNGDKTYGHVNDVYLKTAAYTGVRYSISDVISDQPALSLSYIVLKA